MVCSCEIERLTEGGETAAPRPVAWQLAKRPETLPKVSAVGMRDIEQRYRLVQPARVHNFTDELPLR
jgi:hypothetical protein